MHFGGKSFQVSHNETQLILHLALRFKVFDMGFQMLQPGTHTSHALFKFLSLNLSEFVDGCS